MFDLNWRPIRSWSRRKQVVEKYKYGDSLILPESCAMSLCIGEIVMSRKDFVGKLSESPFRFVDETNSNIGKILINRKKHQFFFYFFFSVYLWERSQHEKLQLNFLHGIHKSQRETAQRAKRKDTYVDDRIWEIFHWLRR